MGNAARENAIGAVIDAYAEWLLESAEVESAYRRWSAAGSTDTALTFADYVAALDREDLASDFYAQVIRRAVRLCEADARASRRLSGAA
jgi:hypothetical protein